MIVYAWGEFELDTGAQELRHHGSAVAMEPRPFSVLRYLVEHRERCVSVGELEREVWCASVSTDAVYTALTAVRRAIGQHRHQSRPIEKSWQGYTWLTPVSESLSRQPRPAPKLPNHVWRRYAAAAASGGARTAAECVAMADELVRAEAERYQQRGALP